ncbi:MAG: UDP-galactopyranose mutase [Bacteroides stercoris]
MYHPGAFRSWLIFDNNYFNDPYQGIPMGGYNRLIGALLENIEVRTGTDYMAHRKELDALAEKVLYTGCIDEYFDYACGHLEYRSLRFEHKHLTDIEDFQGNAVVNYTDRETPYTRVIEHKYFEFGKQHSTVITYEYPDDFEQGKEPYYPVNDEKNNLIFKRVSELLTATEECCSAARTGAIYVCRHGRYGGSGIKAVGKRERIIPLYFPALARNRQSLQCG